MPNKNLALIRHPKTMEVTPYELTHGVWFALRLDAYSTQELANRLYMPYAGVDRAVKQLQRRGFVRFDGLRYHTVRPMGWHYDSTEQRWKHTPLTRPIIHRADNCAA